METQRWLSRKFITTLAAQAAAIAVLLFPGHESQITEAGTSIAALLVLVLTALGYVREEAALDRARIDRGP